MARPLRFEYAGAMYHVIARVNGGKPIFPKLRDRPFARPKIGVENYEKVRVHSWRRLTRDSHQGTSR